MSIPCGEFRVCPKCHESIKRVDYGSQGYCKSCWREYQRDACRQRATRRAITSHTFAGRADALNCRLEGIKLKIEALNSEAAYVRQLLVDLATEQDAKLAETLPEYPNDNA